MDNLEDNLQIRTGKLAKSPSFHKSFHISSGGGFRQRVEVLVEQIPKGRVMTYGQIAALCGSPRAARIVGGIAHYGDPSLPWQRVVMKDGKLATGFPGGVEGHKKALEAEGVKVSEDYRVDVEMLLWLPTTKSLD